MSSYVEEPTPQPVKWKRYEMVSAFLGWLGAVDLLLMAFYLLTIFLAVSAIPPIERLLFPVYFATILTVTSAIILIYGSYLIWKSKIRKGGIINLLVGTLVPIPTYIYFTFLSQPSLLGWLFPIGCFLLAPAIISGAISILLSKFNA